MKANKHPEIIQLLVVDSAGREVQIRCSQSNRIKGKKQINISASQYKHPAWNIGSNNHYIAKADNKYADFDQFF